MEGNNTPKVETFDAVLLAVAWIQAVMSGDETIATALVGDPETVYELVVGLGCVATGVLFTVEEAMGVDPEHLLEVQRQVAIEGLVKAGRRDG